MIVLDTNVLSALMRQIPDAKIIAWLDQQPRSSIWITSITLLEIRFGLEITPAGKKRSQLTTAFKLLLERIDHRILPFDSAAAEESADLMATRQKKGQPRELRDTMIAGIVVANHASLATGNTAHFHDLPAGSLIDPWKA